MERIRFPHRALLPAHGYQCCWLIASHLLTWLCTLQRTRVETTTSMEADGIILRPTSQSRTFQHPGTLPSLLSFNLSPSTSRQACLFMISVLLVSSRLLPTSFPLLLLLLFLLVASLISSPDVIDQVQGLFEEASRLLHQPLVHELVGLHCCRQAVSPLGG